MKTGCEGYNITKSFERDDGRNTIHKLEATMGRACRDINNRRSKRLCIENMKGTRRKRRPRKRKEYAVAK